LTTDEPGETVFDQRIRNYPGKALFPSAIVKQLFAEMVVCEVWLE
jgi:hypothetical protein